MRGGRRLKKVKETVITTEIEKTIENVDINEAITYLMWTLGKGEKEAEAIYKDWRYKYINSL